MSLFNDVKEFPPENSADEAMIAVRRTQAEMRASEEVDIGELTRRAVEAFWENKKKLRSESEVEVRTSELELATVAGLRKTAADLEKWQAAQQLAEVKTLRLALWLDVGAVAIPVVLACLSIVVPTVCDINVPRHLPQVGVGISVFAAIGALYAGTVYAGRGALADLPIFTFLPNWSSPFVSKLMTRGASSLGALAAGFVVAAVLGSLLYQNQKELQYVNVALTEGALSSFAVKSLAAAREKGRFLELPRSQDIPIFPDGEHLPVASAIFIKDMIVESGHATYVAALKGGTGNLSLKLRPSGGDLEWHRDSGSEVRDRIVFGSLVSHDAKELVLKDESGMNWTLLLGSLVEYEVNPHSCLVASFSASTKMIRDIRSVKCDSFQR